MISDRRSFLKTLGLGFGTLGFLSTFPGALANAGVIHGKMSRSTPEAQGVRSEGILNFLKALETSKHEFHSLMIARHGKIVAEGWWAPYEAELNHMLYSLSKSFTSTAVGFAKSEGKLSVQDPVISFFPQQLPETISENLRALKIRDLLTMSVGHAQDSTPSITKQDDWVKTFLALPIANPPGSVFLYNSGATYMLSAIVQKVTGQKAIDYLTPRLFNPLGIGGMTWETCPQGINTGGWGLSLQTESLAKFGQLYLQKGAWKGHQLIPEDWVEEATSFKIQQPGQDLDKLKRESDWHQGYCYQFWRCRHNAFRGDGAFGQYTIVIPEQDAVVAITSESPSMQGEMNLIWEHLWPAFSAEKLEPNREAAAELKHKLNRLRLSPPSSPVCSSIASRISGKPFGIAQNDSGISETKFEFGKRNCVFTLRNDQGAFPITCGLGEWVKGVTTMPGTPPKLTVGAIERPKVAASGTWKDEQTFEMTWRFIETPHHDTVTCRFDGDAIKLEFLNSIAAMGNRKDTRPTLEGKLKLA